LAAAVLLAAYPVRSFGALDGLPAWLPAAWLLVAAAAWRFPGASLAAFVAGSPLLPIVPRLAGWPPVSLGELWLEALLVPVFLRIAAGRRNWRGGLPASFSLLAALATASLVVSMYPFQTVADGWLPFLAEVHAFLSVDLAAATSQTHRFGSVGAWLTLMDGLALLWLVVSEPARDPRRFVRQIAIAGASGAVAVALIGTIQWWTRWNLLPLWLQQDPNVVRINATFPDVNSLGAFLVLWVWMPLAVAAPGGPRLWRWGWRLGVGAVLAAAVFTGSRAAWAGLLVGVLAWLAGGWRAGLLRPPRWIAAHLRVAAAAALVAVVVTGAALTTYATMADVRHGDQRSYVTRLLYTLNLRTSLDYRLRNRVAMWEAAVRMIAAHPAGGIGIGRYYKEAWAYADRREAMIRPRENAHNYYLQVAAELGLTGLAVFVALLGWGLAAAWRGLGCEDAASRRIALASGAGVLAFAVTLLGGHSLLLREGQLGFWTVVALAALAARGGGADRSAGSVRIAGWRRPVLAFLLIGVAASVPFRAAQASSRVDLTRLASGLHGEETGADGRPFSWTDDRAVLHVPAAARAVAFELRSLAPAPQTVTMLVDGREADTLVLDDHAWRPLRYLVPRRRSTGRFVRIEIRVWPTWRPPGDGRELGAMIRDFRWEP